jgi:hypothetical protein
MKDKEDLSIKSDIKFAGITIAAFFVVLYLANVLNAIFPALAPLNIVDFAVTISKIGVASASAWLLIKMAFKNTIGRSIGKVFDAGWELLSSEEKARWCIGAFLALFLSIAIMS